MKQTKAILAVTLVTASLATLALAQSTKTINILGAFGGAEATKFQAVIDVFEAKNPGIKVNYSTSADFNTVLNVRVQSGDYPDIAGIPQPGVMKDLAKQGALAPVAPATSALIRKNYSPAWSELGKANDKKIYGVFHRVNVKGLVFYNKAAFEGAGYKVPKTWVELQAFCRIKEAGGGDRASTTVNGFGIAPNAVYDFESIFDGFGVEVNLTSDPLVVDFGGLGAEHDVLEPICGNPTRSTA